MPVRPPSGSRTWPRVGALERGGEVRPSSRRGQVTSRYPRGPHRSSPFVRPSGLPRGGAVQRWSVRRALVREDPPAAIVCRRPLCRGMGQRPDQATGSSVADEFSDAAPGGNMWPVSCPASSAGTFERRRDVRRRVEGPRLSAHGDACRATHRGAARVCAWSPRGHTTRAAPHDTRPGSRSNGSTRGDETQPDQTPNRSLHTGPWSRRRGHGPLVAPSRRPRPDLR